MMRKILKLLLLLLVSYGYLQSQDSLNYFSYTVTPQGDTINRINYDKKEGRWLSYDSMGRRVESFYVDGKKQGSETKFTKSGVALEKATYKNGQLNGKITEYWDGTDRIYSVIEYKNGKQDGKTIMYYENGNISRESNYIDGLENGKFITYYKSGAKSVTGEMQNGKASGTWQVFSPIFGKIKEFNFNSEGKKIKEKFFLWGIKIKEKP